MRAAAIRVAVASRWCFALAVIALWLPTGSATAGVPATLTGRVSASQLNASLATLGPIVIYLESRSDQSIEPPSAEPIVIHQKNARFSPSFAVVVAGQRVSMINNDLIYHNVFSYSKPNDFDLGVYPAGESRIVTLEYPGVVRTYCSIHENMNGTIFVAPTPYFAVVEPDGEYRIEGVPPGRYRLVSWCEKLPTTVRDIEVAAGQSRSVRIDLSETAPPPAR